MTSEKRLIALENAHRQLAARNEALMQICKVMLPLALSSNQAMVRRLVTSCYDITNEHMDKSGMDDEFQTMVRRAMDELSSSLLSVSTPKSRPS